MKKLIILLVTLLATAAMAQERSVVTIKGSEVNNGVIILNVHQTDPARQGKASFDLQCTKNLPDCANPPQGQYVMVRLPKNWGAYECACVDLYPATGDPLTSPKIGEYCLLEK
jgi:hypothetical protein